MNQNGWTFLWRNEYGNKSVTKPAPSFMHAVADILADGHVLDNLISAIGYPDYVKPLTPEHPAVAMLRKINHMWVEEGKPCPECRVDAEDHESDCALAKLISNPPAPQPARPPFDPPLQQLFDEAMAWFNGLTPEQQAAHREEQKQSWVRGEMALGLENRKDKP